MTFTPDHAATLKAIVAMGADLTRGELDAITAALAEIDRLTLAAREARELIESLPGGIDRGARADDLSPADHAAHVGGLVWQVLNGALEDAK